MSWRQRFEVLRDIIKVGYTVKSLVRGHLDPARWL